MLYGSLTKTLVSVDETWPRVVAALVSFLFAQGPGMSLSGRRAKEVGASDAGRHLRSFMALVPSAAYSPARFIALSLRLPVSCCSVASSLVLAASIQICA